MYVIINMSKNKNTKRSTDTKYKRLKKAHNVNKNQHYYKNNNY